jgi:uncharacterized cupin superfamily protein
MIVGILNFDLAAVEPDIGAPPPDRLISGSPQFRTWNLEDRPDGLFAGVWESTPGKWRIKYDEWEYCRIISGVSIISDADGAESRVGPGDSFILRPGFSGTWEVVETTRKEYVIKV